jgi:2-polyprenyl-3-methyl-5-hydroxy-6-metoxy-1,4-benzoquinol methylase
MTDPHPSGDRGAKADRAYWDALWEAERESPARALPQFGYPERTLAGFFRGWLSDLPADGRSLLEVGCARSSWLPYFAREHGLTVAGLDYSPVGCEQARRVLHESGVQAQVHCADLFTPPEELQRAFGVVVSMGVVEHFLDTRGAVAAIARFARPGGLVITTIPNLSGAVGLFQKVLNRPVYDKHVPLDAHQLRAAHEEAGLRVLECRYFLSTSFGVTSLDGLEPGASKLAKRILLAALRRTSQAVWTMEQHVRPLPATQALSPYIVCVARSAGA